MLETVRKNNIDLAHMLLLQEANVEVSDGAGCTPLWLAAEMDESALVKLLLFYGADVDAKRYPTKITALMRIVIFGNLDVMQQWLESKSNIDAQNSEDYTDLHFLTMRAKEPQHFSCLNLLLSRNANICAKIVEGETALDLARINPHNCSPHRRQPPGRIFN